MLRQIIRPYYLTSFSFLSFSLKYPVIPRSVLLKRSFWTSSRLNQRYQYVRFGDPQPDPSQSGRGGPGGQGRRGGSFFQAFWNRLSSGQRLFFVGVGGGAPIFYVTHLETVPETGRRRFIFLSRSMEESLGKMGYQQVMQQFGSKVLPDSHPATQMCKRVVARLGQAIGLEGVDWRVHVIDEPVPNAFVLPGGQIFVFTGILPIAKNEAGLATILGHEIAHYTLRHIAEKASLSQFFSILGFFAAWMFGLPLDSFYKVQQLALELPNSRACETEADYVGLLYMAKACYNPEEGPKVWQRMTQMAKGQPKIPKFLSTHPENQDRQERLRSHIDEAMAKWVEAGCDSRYEGFARRYRDGMW